MGAFRGDLDVDDLLQEIAIVFIKTKEYWDPARGIETLQVLFMRNSENRLTDLMRYQQKSKRDVTRKTRMSEISDDGDTPEFGVNREQYGHRACELAMTIEAADPGIQSYINARLGGATKDAASQNIEEPLGAFFQRLDNWASNNFGFQG